MARRGLVAEQLKAILAEAETSVEKQSQDAYRQAADEAVELLQGHSPKKTGDYAAGWTMKPTRTGPIKGYTVYNATNYQLTHLLEKGHAKVNGGRVRAIPHIRPVEQAEIERLLERINRMKL